MPCIPAGFFHKVRRERKKKKDTVGSESEKHGAEKTLTRPQKIEDLRILLKLDDKFQSKRKKKSTLWVFALLSSKSPPPLFFNLKQQRTPAYTTLINTTSFGISEAKTKAKENK